MASKQHILITGGAGYIGSTLTPYLLEAGYAVTVFDRFQYRQTPLLGLCHNPDFGVVHGDVRDEEALRPLVAKADILIPLAAIVGAPACDRDPVAATTVNRDAIQLLCRLSGAHQRILIPITNSGYGIGEADKACTESSPLRPISLYGRTKVEAEEAALATGRAVSFRLATVFGASPRMRVDLLVNDFVHRAVTDRTVVLFEAHFHRNYIHIRDVAAAFAFAIEHFQSMRGEAYNVGLSDANLTKKELCEEIQRHLPAFQFFEAPIGEDPDKRDYIVSNEKIEALGFQPRHSLAEGIQELIKAYTICRRTAFTNL